MSSKRLLTKASAWSARARMAGSANGPSSSIGTSLSECTAQSASPRSIATSSSLRNSPLPPIAASERSSTSSPRVVIGTSTTSSPGCAARSRSAACSLCHRASGLLRVAMRIVAMRHYRRCGAIHGRMAGTTPPTALSVGSRGRRGRSPDLQALDDFLEGGDAAAADFQRLLAVAQDRVDVAVGFAAQLEQLVARDQAVAVDAHEAFAELLFQRLERLLDQVLAARVVHDHVLFLGLQVVDVLDR